MFKLNPALCDSAEGLELPVWGHLGITLVGSRPRGTARSDMWSSRLPFRLDLTRYKYSSLGQLHGLSPVPHRIPLK
jgi:hypothetical protein